MPHRGRHTERGNIFFTLFGAVALVGVIGAATTTLIRGPLSTVSNVNMKTKADTQLQIASKLAMIRATEQDFDLDGVANESSCDGDPFVEPVPPDTSAPVKPVGGGGLPSTFGATQTDPWGTRLGYCVWDLGVETDTAGCGGPSGPRRLGGDDRGQPILVIMSAGPNRVFETSCEDWADNRGVTGPIAPSNESTLVNKPTTSDDIIVAYDYDEAVTAADGLWSIKASDPDTITTDKNVEFSSSSTTSFQGSAMFQSSARFDTGSRLDLGLGGLFMLPDQTALVTCDAANDGALRINTAAANMLQMCDQHPDSLALYPDGWVTVGGAGASAGKIDDLSDAISYAGPEALFLGEDAGLNYNSATGTRNIGIGIGAGSAMTSGSNNVVIGHGSNTAATANGNIILGNDIDVVGSGNLNIGNVLFGTSMYSSASGRIGVGGPPSLTARLDVDGTVEASQYTFGADPTTAIFGGAANMAFAVAGTQIGLFDAGGMEITGDADVSGDIFGNRFIASAAGTASLPAFAFETNPDTGLFYTSGGIGFSIDGTWLMNLSGGVLGVGVDGDFNGNDVTANSFLVNAAGNGMGTNGSEVVLANNGVSTLLVGNQRVGIGNNNVPATTLDVDGEIKLGSTAAACGPATHGTLRYYSGDKLQLCSSTTGDWETIGTTGGGGGGSGSLWTNNTTYITRGTMNVMNSTADYPAALENSAGFVWHAKKSAIRAGAFNSSGDTDIGYYAYSFGNNAIARGNNSFAAGYYVDIDGQRSVALGSNLTVYGTRSVALGDQVYVDGDYSIGLGTEVFVQGSNSMAIGLGGVTGFTPTVSGNKSLGIFMGDQSGVNVVTSNLMAILGGRVMIDPDQTSATNLVPSNMLTVDVEGDIGAIQYCDQNGMNCFTAADIAAGGLGAPGNDRELIFNSGGSLWTDATFKFTSAGNLDINTTGALILPRGDTAQRPTPYVNGMMRYNSALGRFEGYQSGAWTNLITSAATAAGNAGEIQFNSNGVFSATSNLFWDWTNARLGVGTNAPAVDVDVRGGGSMSLQNGAGTAAMAMSGTGNGSTYANLTMMDSGNNRTWALSHNQAAANNFSIMYTSSGGSLSTMFITPGGDVLFGSSGTIAAGLKLDVEGRIGADQYCDGNGLNCFQPTSLSGAQGVDGAVQFASGGKLWASTNLVYNSAGHFGIGTSTPTTMLDVRGTLRIGNGGEGCDGTQTGAIRYVSGQLDYCNGSTWTSSSGSKTFLALTDTPASYSSAANYIVKVNPAANALVFTDELFPSVTGQPAPTFIGLDHLTDVVITSPQGKNILMYNSTSGQWENAASSSLTFSAAGSTGQIQFNSGGSLGAGANLTWNASTNTFVVNGDIEYSGIITDTSDRRLKTDISPLRMKGSMLDAVGQIETYTFRMKNDPAAAIEYGVMAQEIQKIFPDLVKVADPVSGYMSVNYIGLIAPVIEATKELKSDNDALRAQLASMESRMASLEGDMKGMKAHTGYGISRAGMTLAMFLMVLAAIGGAVLILRRGPQRSPIRHD